MIEADAALRGVRYPQHVEAATPGLPQGRRAATCRSPPGNRDHDRWSRTQVSDMVTDMRTPGTYRVADGSYVDYSAAIAAWTAAALPVLEGVARTYHATITYQELGDQVQDATGIHTRVLLMNWIGQVLGGASRESHRRGLPMLSALCVHSDGTVGDGYGQAIAENYACEPPWDLDMHAAQERLRCYQLCGAVLPRGGGKPALTSQVATRRAWAAERRRADVSSQRYCPTCNLTLPLSGNCEYCS
jgi:hypothetical protein